MKLTVKMNLHNSPSLKCIYTFFVFMVTGFRVDEAGGAAGQVRGPARQGVPRSQV